MTAQRRARSMSATEITYWANEIRAGRANLAPLDPRGRWFIVPLVPLVLSEPADGESS